MRLRDLRWHIIAAIILIISYAALAICFYMTIRGKAISSLENITMDTVEKDTLLVDETIESYNQRFLLGTFEGLVTDFNSTGYAEKFFDTSWIIEQHMNIILGSVNPELCVFFYQPNASEGCPKQGYIPLKEVLNFTDQKFVLFNASAGIKYNQYSDEVLSDMGAFLDDENFLENFNKDLVDGKYINMYNIGGQECVLAIQAFHQYYFALIVPVASAIFSVQWVMIQAITFFVIGIVILGIILALFIMGCRKASVLLRVDRHSVENIHSLVVRVKRDGTVIFSNIAFKKLFNMKSLPDLNDFKEINSDLPIFQFFKEKRTIQCYYVHDGVKRYLQFTPIGVLATFYLVGNDVTDEYFRMQELERLNGKNEITGCDNNFELSNRFPMIMSHAQNDIAFIEFSIYKFAEIISLFGNENYQVLLQELYNIFKVQFEGMNIYQTRDERFIVVMPNEKLKDVVILVNKTMVLMKKPILVYNNNIYVTLKSVICNIAHADLEHVSLSEIKRRLDLAYQSIVSFASKNVIVYEEGMEGAISVRKQLEQDLKVAIKEQQFVQYLQPQYDVVSNKIVGFESLIRWKNEKYFNKSPQEFIELAEHNGYILEIAPFVIDNTFKLAKMLEPYNVTVSMNLSPIQIIQVGFVSDLRKKFIEYQLKPNSVALEITETFLMENFSLVNEKLKVLKNEGFRIHLDDFGTGYSSMAYLKDLPVDTIKIDFQFTKYVDTNKVNYSIVSCISTLAKELGLDVIVEGVETQSQRDVVKKLGCRIIQGYLIGKPMPFEEAEEMLKKMNLKK